MNKIKVSRYQTDKWVHNIMYFQRFLVFVSLFYNSLAEYILNRAHYFFGFLGHTHVSFGNNRIFNGLERVKKLQVDRFLRKCRWKFKRTKLLKLIIFRDFHTNQKYFTSLVRPRQKKKKKKKNTGENLNRVLIKCLCNKRPIVIYVIDKLASIYSFIVFLPWFYPDHNRFAALKKVCFNVIEKKIGLKYSSGKNEKISYLLRKLNR